MPRERTGGCHGDHGDHGEHLGEHVRDLVVEKLKSKAAARERTTAKGRMQAEALELLSDRISSLDLWTRVPPGERRTRITRDELAAAAVRLADTEGFDALSMRRLAQELGVGTMSLYHYVRNKEELLTLVNDAVMAELVLGPDETMPSDWRAALDLVAHRSRAALVRHPWVLDLLDDPGMGPNSFRHFDETLEAVASIDLPLGDRLDIASSIDEFVFGYCLMERMNDQAGEPDRDEIVAYLQNLLETEPLPTLRAIVDDIGFDGLWDVVMSALATDDRFDRHLQRILDGIEADIKHRRRR